MREKLTLKLATIITTIAFGLFLVGIMAVRASITAETPEDIGKLLSCLPPSSLGCTDQISYVHLQQRQKDLGIAGSEIGADQLGFCNQEIVVYQRDLVAYNSCAPSLNLNFNETDANTYMGPYVCSAFLGNNGVYNKTTKMCECSNGYLLYENECKTPIEICQNKYGPGVYVNGGNCVATQKGTPTPSSYIPPHSTISPIISTPKQTALSPTPSKEPQIGLNYVPLDSSGGVRETVPSKSTNGGIMNLLNTIGQIIKNFFQTIF